MSDLICLYVTTSSKEEAQKIARHLVEHKLCACVNIVGPVESHYMWDGKLETSSEMSLFVKTRLSLEEKVIEEILKYHSYECPCILSLPIQGGHEPFLKFIKKETMPQ